NKGALLVFNTLPPEIQLLVNSLNNIFRGRHYMVNNIAAEYGMDYYGISPSFKTIQATRADDESETVSKKQEPQQQNLRRSKRSAKASVEENALVDVRNFAHSIMNINHDKYEAVIGLEVHAQLFTNS